MLVVDASAVTELVLGRPAGARRWRAPRRPSLRPARAAPRRRRGPERAATARRLRRGDRRARGRGDRRSARPADRALSPRHPRPADLAAPRELLGLRRRLRRAGRGLGRRARAAAHRRRAPGPRCRSSTATCPCSSPADGPTAAGQSPTRAAARRRRATLSECGDMCVDLLGGRRSPARQGCPGPTGCSRSRAQPSQGAASEKHASARTSVSPGLASTRAVSGQTGGPRRGRRAARRSPRGCAPPARA